MNHNISFGGDIEEKQNFNITLDNCLKYYTLQKQYYCWDCRSKNYRRKDILNNFYIVSCVKRKRFLLILTILLENNDIRSRGYKDIKIILNSQSKTEGFKDKITIYQEYLTDGL
ncbi:hypothetical protein U3516DRAFT_742697 [Neocallimastix sp. 'constans']